MTYFAGYDNSSPVRLKDFYTAFEGIVDQNMAVNNIFLSKSAAQDIEWIEGNAIFAANRFGITEFAISYTVETKGMPTSGVLPIPPWRIGSGCAEYLWSR